MSLNSSLKKTPTPPVASNADTLGRRSSKLPAMHASTVGARADSPPASGENDAGAPHMGDTFNTTFGALSNPTDISSAVEMICNNCREYVFPSSKHHAHKALVRISVYAKYGPAHERDNMPRLRLNGGHRPLQDHEERLLLEGEEKNLITEVLDSHSKKPKLAKQPTDAEVSEMATYRPRLVDAALEVTRVELDQILNAVKAPKLPQPPPTSPSKATLVQHTGPDAKVLLNAAFLAVSNALLAERSRRVKYLRVGVPVLTELRSDSDVTKKQTTRFYNKTVPRPERQMRWEDSRHVLKSLHTGAFKICEAEDTNKGDVVLNVRCLRDEYRRRPTDVDEGWDGYCCLRKSRLYKF